MQADTPDLLRDLLDEVERQQEEGRYVAVYLAYEAGAAFDLTVPQSAPDALPLAWMAAYDPGSAVAVSPDDWRRLLSQRDVSEVAKALSDVTPELSVTREEYTDAIGRVREYIAAGDTYQVNYTVRGRFSLDTVDPLDYFLALAIRQPVPYAAYIDLGDAQVISLSPEMFLRRDGRTLESRPMKGTRPRGVTHAHDIALAYELAETEKERAENLMIVDMVRNDLGRVCRAGSVRVPTLYAVEPYRTVWQMVSTVVGEVHPRAGLAEIMQAVFPGASITGAPKHHTMEIIAELETEPRGVYTGTVALFSPGGDFAANIAIRTITHRQGRCVLGVGSGVVWDANAEAEYDETLTKAAFATPPHDDASVAGGLWRPDPEKSLREAASQSGFYLFETILLQATELTAASLSDEAALNRFTFLDAHLDRMSASALSLGLSFEREKVFQLLAGLARIHPEALVARVQLDSAGNLSLSSRQVPDPPNAPVALLVSPFRTDPDDPLLGHKTSLRGFYDREYRRASARGAFDALFVNRLDRVTEGAITNLFARFGDLWLTPPLDDGLLPGLWRAGSMEQKKAKEASLSLQDLRESDELLVGNSVRGAVPVGSLVVEPLMS